MQVAVYSGSFDPLHKGHLGILRRLAELYDAVYMVVSPQNPLKEKGKALNAQQRLQAARASVARYPELDGKVRLDDIEFSLPQPSYTICTLDALKAREPGNSFTLAIGADNLADIRRWKDYTRILLEYGLTVFPRRGTDLQAAAQELLMENPDYRIRLMKDYLADVSSTQLRESLSRGKDVSGLLM